MSWTATLVIAHAPSESPLELRSALVTEGRRCLVWESGTEPPAGAREADVVVVMSGAASSVEDDARTIRGVSPRALLLALASGPTGWADAVSHPQTAIKPISDRVGALVRLTTLEWECEQRRTTFETLGGTKFDDRGPKPPATIRALHIGGPNPEFGHLQDTLRKNDIELRPVLRPSLALDEIENGLVDAVLLDASVSPQTVRELSIILRRNTDLALSPVLVLDPKSAQQPGARAPSLISDVIKAQGSPDLVVVRLKQLVTETRRRRAALTLLKRSRARNWHDARTGLAIFPLLDAHLATHLKAAAQSGRALSAGLLRAQPRNTTLSGNDAQSFSEQIGSLIARLIRAEDMAALTSQNTVAFLFPSTLETSAHAAMKRISAVLGATRFHSPKDAEGIAVDVDWSVAQPRAGQSGAELWDVGDMDAGAIGNGV